MVTPSPKGGSGGPIIRIHRETQLSRVKLGKLRPLSLSHVLVSFESPRRVVVIKGSVFLRTLFWGGGTCLGRYWHSENMVS